MNYKELVLEVYPKATIRRIYDLLRLTSHSRGVGNILLAEREIIPNSSKTIEEYENELYEVYWKSRELYIMNVLMW